MAQVTIYIPGMDIPEKKGIKYGDYAVIFDEHGNALVFDAGQRPASAILREWIKKQKFKRIWMVGTHAHTDHVNGIIDSINDPDIKVDKVWYVKPDYMKSYMASKYKKRPWYSVLCQMYTNCGQGLIDLCKKKEIATGYLATGTQIRIGDIHCRILWQAQNSYGNPDNDKTAGRFINNSSPLTLFDFGYFTAGDNEMSCSEARKACREVVIAQIPHHGNYVDTEAFNKLRPKAAWYNYGEVGGAIGKDKGFTSWTVPGLQAKGIDIWNNFRDGDILMKFTDEYVCIAADRNDRTKIYPLGAYRNWSRTDQELAVEVMLRMHGNGDSRRNALGTRWSDVQKVVEKFLDDRDALIEAMADYVLRDLAGSGDKRRQILGGYWGDVQKVVTKRLRG